VGDRLHVSLDLHPFLPHAIQQAASAGAQVLLNIIDDLHWILQLKLF
jgi:hypothetical protein